MLNKRASFGFNPPPSPSPQPRPASVSGYRSMEMATTSSDEGGKKAPENADPLHVKVVVRIRPSSHNDASIPPRFLRTVLKPASDAEVKLDVDPALLAGHGLGGVAGPSGSKKAPSFSYDRVLPEDSTQMQVYEATALSAVDKFMKGFNVTILAYGQTSSGKSYSMGTTGVEADYSASPTTPTSSPSSLDRSSRIGIIPRAVSDIFEKAEQIRKASGPGASFDAKLSFLELYNEDLIDLLSPANGPQVQIREDREGRIIWSGLKEVKVKNTTEVMQYLKEGSARRRTGETGMNATSSRSHAIFSLSLVQRRKAHLNASPSGPGKGGIPRPASTTGLPRSVTPSGTRSQTPSSFTPGKSGLMRPASMYGARPGSPAVVAHQEDDDEWVTTTGKFNMVDLAGSERLKRTAAQGERMKEGIAINSGLLALGNVISALGDPAKARTTTYIPYRDSKLTRLLQDSLGGNAYTVMIACVSPIEYNAGETLNTLKYAARARNIKNAAKANQVEAGWDDVEHLQSTVLRLRKELGTLKTAVEESGTNVKNLNAITEESQGHPTKVSQRFAEMMREHDELNRQLLEKSGEIARLTGEVQTSRAGATGASSSFHDDVAPIIGEYEKAIASFEARIQTLQTTLAVSNAERDEQEELLEELDTRQVQQEAYIAELKARVSRLGEREASHETYIHDLELKLKVFAEKEESTSDAVADLRKEIARHKEAEAEIALYVAELERRLSKSDAETSDLRSKVENFENELQRRDEMYRELEARMATLDTSAETKQLLSELEVKDQKVADLERMLQSALKAREQVGKDLDKLTESSQLDKAVHEDLARQIKELQANQAQGRPSLTTMRTMSTGDVFLTPAIEISEQILPGVPPSKVDKPEMTPPIAPDLVKGEQTSMPSPGELDATKLGAQVQELQKRQAATLQELEQVSSRYRDALREISDLATQLKEAKLEHAELTDVLPSPSLNIPEDETEAGTPSPGASPRASPRKRNLPRHSSTGSLYELGNRRDFQHGRGSTESNRARPQSLSQELSSAALSPSSHSSWADSTSRLSHVSRNRASMPPTLRPQRSIQSLEQEVMSLQKALKDREVEINHLEMSLKNSHGIPSRKNSASALPLQELFVPQSGTPLPSSIPLPPSPTTASTKSHRSSPVTPSRAQLSAHRRALSVDDDATLNQSEIDRLNELMRSMAQKESAHKELTEKLQAQLVRTERKHAELQTLARDQALNMSTELDALRAQLASVGDNRAALAADAHATALERHTSQHKASLSRLQETHQAELTELHAGSVAAAAEAQKVAASALHALQEEVASASSEHEKQLGMLRAEKSEQLHEANRLATQQLEENLRRTSADNAELLSRAAAEHSRKLDALRTEHDNALDKLQQDRNSLHASNAALTKELAVVQQAVREVDFARQAQTKRAEEAESGLTESLEAVQSLEQALQESDAERGSFKKELSQLRFELSTSRDAYATIVQASSKRDALVAELEKRLAESNAAREAAEAQLAANVTSPAAGRFSLGRTSPNGSQIKHPPPIARPPSMPPPPVPTAAPGRTPSMESADSSSPAVELKLLSQVEESDRIIATLNKQLSHCEADLQANIDMVNTLESALNDSERNLRKARLQTTEMARERDAQTAQTDALRQQLRNAEQEVQTARNSVTTERQGLEKRLQEEQLAKERARAQLEARVTAMQSKQSKFQCF